jgi:hypothetical protein
MKRIALLLVLILAASVSGTTSVSATKPDPNHKVTICHALPTSASHAFNVLTVDIASSGYVRGGHHRPGGSLGSKHSEGGDIIPPYQYRDFDYPGQNWTRKGRAIFENGCRTPNPTPRPTPNPTPTPKPTPTPHPTPPPTPTPTPTPDTYDVSASIIICQDPRAIITLINDSNVERAFRIRFVRARDGSVARLTKTVAAGRTRTLAPRWVLGQSVVKVRSGGELLARVKVNKRNNVGACPSR